jgi:O-antigen/teichoic acid export membrane protein
MSVGSLRARAARGVRWSLAATVVSAGAQAAQLLVLGRLLAPADFGLMGALGIVVGFAIAYTDLGISAAVVQRRDATAEQLSTLYWLNVLAGVGVAVVVALAAPLVARFFGEPALVAPLRATSLVFVLTAAGKQFEMLLQRDLAFDRLARVEVVAAVLGAAAAVAAALAGARYWALVAGALAAAAARAAQLVAVGVRRSRPALHFRWADTRGFVSFGAFQVAEQSINYLGERLDQLLIGRLVGLVPLGLYNFAFNLASQPVSRVNPVVTRVAFPTFCAVQHDPVRLRAGFLQVVGLLTTVNAPVLLGLAAVGPVLVPLAFGPQWLASVPLLQLLCVVALCRCVGNPLGSLLLARGRPDLGFKLNLAFVALNVPALVVGARIAGAAGIAAGLVAVQIVLGVVAYFAVVRRILGPCGGAYAAAVFRPTALAAAMAVVVAAVPPALEGSPPALVLGAQLLTGAAAYTLGLAAVDRGAVRQLVSLAEGRA